MPNSSRRLQAQPWSCGWASARLRASSRRCAARAVASRRAAFACTNPAAIEALLGHAGVMSAPYMSSRMCVVYRYLSFAMCATSYAQGMRSEQVMQVGRRHKVKQIVQMTQWAQQRRNSRTGNHGLPLGKGTPHTKKPGLLEKEQPGPDLPGPGRCTREHRSRLSRKRKARTQCRGRRKGGQLPPRRAVRSAFTPGARLIGADKLGRDAPCSPIAIADHLQLNTLRAHYVGV